MAVTLIKSVTIMVLSIVGVTMLAHAYGTDSSAGELLDNIMDMQMLGLNYWGTDDGSVQKFLIYNENTKRYFQMAGGVVANHVAVVGTSRPKVTGNLFEIRRVDQGFVTIAIDNNTGLGNGAAQGGQVQSGQWLNDSTHQYAITLTGNAIQLVNRGNGLCVTSDGRNESPLTVTSCDTSDQKQTWNFCQSVMDSPMQVDRLCWPRDSSAKRR